MFEKEAEDSFKCKKVLYKWETDKHSYIDGFKDGANFGYNKANEWHYVKDELPKTSGRYLVYTGGEPFILDFDTEVNSFLSAIFCSIVLSISDCKANPV